MTHQDDLHSAGAGSDQPAMELLDGAQAAPPACCPLVSRIVRGTLYGVLLLTATSLLAISAVPELTNYLSFLPGDEPQGTCHLSSGHCATLDVASLKNIEGSPCCPLSAALARSSGGCSKSCADEAGLASVSAELPACCEKGESACEHETCPLATLAETSTDAAEGEPADEDALAKLPAAEDLAGPPAPPVAE